MTSIFLRISHQLFCRISLSLGLYDTSLWFIDVFCWEYQGNIACSSQPVIWKVTYCQSIPLLWCSFWSLGRVRQMYSKLWPWGWMPPLQVRRCLCLRPAQENERKARTQRKAWESFLPRATGFSPFNNIFDYEREKSMIFLFLPSNRKVCVMADTFRKYQVCCYPDSKTCSCNIKPGDYARSCLCCLLIHSCAWIDLNLRNYPM